MFDASKYAEHFPDESQCSDGPKAKRGLSQQLPLPSPLLLAALSRLEREFSDILRAQQSTPNEEAE
jgi:hypothetical protein